MKKIASKIFLLWYKSVPYKTKKFERELVAYRCLQISKFCVEEHNWDHKLKLRKMKNLGSGSILHLNQPLPNYEAHNKQDADKQNFITFNHRCLVSVIVNKLSQKKTKFIDIIECDNLDRRNPFKQKQLVEKTFLTTDRKVLNGIRSKNESSTILRLSSEKWKLTNYEKLSV